MHPADIAKAIHDASDNAEKQRLFEAIEDSSTQAHVLSELSSEHALQILEGMPIIKLSRLQDFE